MNLPDIEAFRVRSFNDGNDPPVVLECPHGCDPIPLGDLLQLLELSILANDHIRAKHLPPLPRGEAYCAGCYSIIATSQWAPWCDVCRGGTR